MATATQNDDLLILDNEPSDTLILDEKPIIEDLENNTSESLITFDNVEESTTDTLELGDLSLETKEEPNLVSSDLNVEESTTDTLELGDLSLETKEEPNLVSSDLNIEESTTDTLELGNLSTETKEEPNLEIDDELSLNSSVNIQEKDYNIGTMVDILDTTIAKLSDRLVINETETNNEENHRNDLKEQISNLEAQVTVSDERITELKSEKALIVKNTKSIERMKNTNITSELKAETSTKVHNVKRKKAVVA